MARKFIITFVVTVILIFTGCGVAIQSNEKIENLQSKTTAKQEEKVELIETSYSDESDNWRNIPYKIDEVDYTFPIEGIECTIVLKGREIEVIRNNEIISKTLFPEDIEESDRNNLFRGYSVGKHKSYYILLSNKMQKPTIEFVDISSEALSVLEGKKPTADSVVWVKGFKNGFPIFKKENGDYVAYIPNDVNMWNYMSLGCNLLTSEKEGKEGKMTFKEVVLNSKKFELIYEKSEQRLDSFAHWKIKVYFDEDETIWSQGVLALPEGTTWNLTHDEVEQFEGKYAIEEFPKIIKEINTLYNDYADQYYNSLLKNN